jgi:phosphoenolpyruvate---glycerone phosphotransferase subunit DhaK
MGRMKWWGGGDEGVSFTHHGKPALGPFLERHLAIDRAAAGVPAGGLRAGRHPGPGPARRPAPRPELAEAEDIEVGTVIVDDDVAVKDSTYTVGRRGVAGNFFVIKALGAASDRGADLQSLVALGDRVNSVTRSMGMALTSCTPPAKGSPLFELGDDEIEMGVGIHGEPGRRREKLTNANAIIDEMLEAVVTDLPYESGDEVALMINGLGGTPISELYILYGRAHDQLQERGIKVGRSYVGEYCTSLDMAGASVTLVKLDDELKELLEAPAEIAARVF